MIHDTLNWYYDRIFRGSFEIFTTFSCIPTLRFSVQTTEMIHDTLNWYYDRIFRGSFQLCTTFNFIPILRFSVVYYPKLSLISLYPTPLVSKMSSSQYYFFFKVCHFWLCHKKNYIFSLIMIKTFIPSYRNVIYHSSCLSQINNSFPTIYNGSKLSYLVNQNSSTLNKLQVDIK